MSNSYAVEERAVLQNSKAKLFDLVCKNATKEQWTAWLTVPLEHAAAAGDVALVNELLAAGAKGKAFWKGSYNRTLLCAAVQGGKLEVVKALPNSGAQPDVNVLGGQRLQSPLHYAALNGCEEIAELLLLNGARPDCKDSEGTTAIHIAAELGYQRIVSLLLIVRATVDGLRHDKTTPLHLAARKGYLAVAKLLLVAGTSMISRNYDGYSALDFAVMGGHVDVIRMLGEHAKGVNDGCTTLSGYKGRTALHCAAQYDQAGAVNVLVELGGDVRACILRTNNSPLHFAAKRGSCGALVALLHHKANIHAKTGDGKSPLMLACMNLHQKAADLLLRWGADETDVDNEGRSADQFIGAHVEIDDHEERQQDMDNMHKLLANAPADRVWRRRGWLVLCRAIPNKAWFARVGSCSVEAGVVGLEQEVLFRHVVTFL
ncbi:unnamed protein product [Sphacelaria rigidula]